MPGLKAQDLTQTVDVAFAHAKMILGWYPPRQQKTLCASHVASFLTARTAAFATTASPYMDNR